MRLQWRQGGLAARVEAAAAPSSVAALRSGLVRLLGNADCPLHGLHFLGPHQSNSCRSWPRTAAEPASHQTMGAPPDAAHIRAEMQQRSQRRVAAAAGAARPGSAPAAADIRSEMRNRARQRLQTQQHRDDAPVLAPLAASSRGKPAQSQPEDPLGSFRKYGAAHASAHSASHRLAAATGTTQGNRAMNVGKSRSAPVLGARPRPARHDSGQASDPHLAATLASFRTGASATVRNRAVRGFEPGRTPPGRGAVAKASKAMAQAKAGRLEIRQQLVERDSLSDPRVARRARGKRGHAFVSIPPPKPKPRALIDQLRAFALCDLIAVRSRLACARLTTACPGCSLGR